MRRGRRRDRRVFLPILAAVLAAGCAAAETAVLSAEDEAQVRALEQAYTSAWEANDRGAVMATLSAEPVLVPDGVGALEGRAAVESFWWPAGSSTTVTSYTTTIDEIGGAGDHAWARGNGDLSFTWSDSSGQTLSRTSASVFLMIARKQDGEWKIHRRMWTDVSQ